jgi:hypothetical protein
MGVVQGKVLTTEPTGYRSPRRVVVKLRDAAALPAGVTVADPVNRVSTEIVERFPDVQVQAYFRDEPPLAAAFGDIAPPSPLIDRQRYLSVDVPASRTAEAVAATIRDLDDVEVAYPEAGPTPPPANPDDDPRSGNQGYLDAAPAGIDARWTWQFADGSGVQFVDLERGWTLHHEDLLEAGIELIAGVNRDFHGHGTAVLGEVVAVDNGRGGVGIAPGATARVVSQWQTDGEYRTVNAIANAASVMRPGDVLLLEAQTTYPTTGTNFVPVEVEELVFDAIRAVVDRGVIVVEAAANGGVDLDTFVDVRGRQVLNRHSADFRDSGAILVGAASATVPHHRLGFSNFGSRVDCFAWGEQIDTAGDGFESEDPGIYTTDFGGTSGASPMVAGCALLLQSLRRARQQAPFPPEHMRRLLADVELNTTSASPSDRIGVMPNLQGIVQQEAVALVSEVQPPPAKGVTV